MKHRKGGRTKGGSPQIYLTVPQIARVRELKGIGLSVAAVARVVTHETGLDVGPGTVRHHTRDLEGSSSRWGDRRSSRAVGISHSGGLGK